MRKADIRFIKRVEIPNVELMHEYAGLLEPARRTGRGRIMVVDGRACRRPRVAVRQSRSAVPEAVRDPGAYQRRSRHPKWDGRPTERGGEACDCTFSSLLHPASGLSSSYHHV